ncbi:hypothetical protein ABID14_001785 [Peptoniphilus olsenii]|uniref:Lipoprotein n=1 Tax=Peptoniphilus olsenii TaxID=411570 RepID=A0ABV2JBI0_9FIRM
MKKGIIALVIIIIFGTLFYNNKTKVEKTEESASAIGIIEGVDDEVKSSEVQKEDLVSFEEIVKSEDVVFDKNINKKNFTEDKPNSVNAFGFYDAEDDKNAVVKATIIFNKVDGGQNIDFEVYSSTNELLGVVATLRLVDENGNEKNINIEANSENPTEILKNNYIEKIESSKKLTVDISNIFVKTSKGKSPLVQIDELTVTNN